jgi:excisionase family DNA binding protein
MLSTIHQHRVAFQNKGGVMAEEVAAGVARLNSIEATMARLGVGRSTVFAGIGSGQLRSVKVGRRRLVPESAITQFIQNLETAGGGDAA